MSPDPSTAPVLTLEAARERSIAQFAASGLVFYECHACGTLSNEQRPHYAIMRLLCRGDWRSVRASRAQEVGQ